MTFEYIQGYNGGGYGGAYSGLSPYSGYAGVGGYNGGYNAGGYSSGYSGIYNRNGLGYSSLGGGKLKKA